MKNLAPRDEAGDVPTWQQTYHTVPFTIPGTLTTGVGQTRFVMPLGGRIINVLATVGTSPSGGSAIFDLNKNGTSIFSTQANRPTITTGTNIDNASIPDSVTFTVGDYFTVDVDAANSAADAVIVIYYRYETL